MKLDVLAIAAHPDDAEISAGASIARLVSEGKKAGILDLTRGELGTRGSAELRDQEALRAAEILGLSARHNIGLPDGFFQNVESSQRLIIEQVRRFQPDVILANTPSDRHPDHGIGAKLAADACFLSGLRKIETTWEGKAQAAWRPRMVMHYIQDYYHEPDIVWDVSDFFETKMNAIKAFSSQFYDPKSDEPDTPISGKDFFEMLEARAISLGRPAGMRYAEGFLIQRIFGVNDLFSLI